MPLLLQGCDESWFRYLAPHSCALYFCLTAICTCFDIPFEDRGRIWTSTFSLLHHLYLTNDADVLKSMTAIHNRNTQADQKSFFSGRFDRRTNAGNRLESDVELCAILADLSDLTRAVAEKKRLTLLNAHVPSHSITWKFPEDRIQLTCLLVVLLRRPA